MCFLVYESNVWSSKQSFLLSYSWRVPCWVIICWCVFLRFMDQICPIPSSLLSFPICEGGWKIDNICYATFDSKVSSIIHFIFIWWESYWDTKISYQLDLPIFYSYNLWDWNLFCIVSPKRYSDLLIYPPCHNKWEANYRQYSNLMVWGHTRCQYKSI